VRSRIAAAVVLAAALAACGKKGPPLAPIILVPARPDAFTAARRGGTVHIEFVVPGANTDGSRPANVSRVEVYGFTGPASATDADLLRLGRRIASVEVNEPPDPDRQGAEPTVAPARSGVDQGATVRITEALTSDVMTPVNLPPTKPGAAATPKPAAGATPTTATPVPAAPAVPSRIYVAVAAAGRGTGPVSRRSVVPLVPAPPVPASPDVSYDEQAVRIRWPALAGGEAGRHHVYEVGRADGNGVPLESRLSKEPVTALSFDDARVEWGTARCYTIRAVLVVGGVAVESDAPPSSCVTMTDTFPPPPPSGLTAVSSVGAVSLIWDAAPAPDLAGYLILKGAPGGPLTPATPAPVPETTFRDTVSPGTRVAYAVQAVDKSGNVSVPSATVEETAR